MVARQEISLEDVRLVRAESLGPDDRCAMPDEHPAVADRPSEVAPAPKAAIADQPMEADMLKALAWATGLKDHALIVGLAGPLPHAVLEEQMRAYLASTAVAEAPKPEPEPPKIY